MLDRFSMYPIMIRVISVLAMLALHVGAGLADSSLSSTGDAYDREADLEQLAWWVSMEHSFTYAGSDEAQRVIAGHRNDKTPFTEPEFYMEVRRIVGLADNGHSNVSTHPIYDEFGLLPLRTYWFADGLYIVLVRNQHEDLLGARIEAISGRPLGELETRLMDYHGGSKSYFRHYSAASLMLSPALMHAIGLSESPDRLTLQLKSRTGEDLEVELHADPDSSAVQEKPWRYLLPASTRGADGWSPIHDSSMKLPLYLQQPEKLFRYILIEDGAIAYIQLRANIGSDDQSISDFVARTLKRLELDHPRSIILDNRQNPGGDLTLTADFALALRDSGYGIGYALQLHDLANGCPDPEKCHMTQYAEDWNIAVGSLEPDWPIPATFADFESGHDRALERILEDAAEHR